MTQLIVKGEPKSVLAIVKTVKDAKDYSAQARLMRDFAKQTGMGRDQVNKAAEVYLWTQYGGGRLLKQLMDSKQRHSGRGNNKKLGLQPATPKLADLEIEKTQASRWQALASIPEKEFEGFIRSTLDGGGELTTSAALVLARETRSAAKRKTVAKSVVSGGAETSDLSELAGQKFGCIYADPPWQYGNQSTRASTDKHYVTMTIDQICEMPISGLAAPESHLHLWTTNAFLFDAKRVMEAWGFEYKSCFIWVKPQMGIGNYWRVSHEFMLLGVRGGLTFADHGQMSWLECDRGEHSAKPPAIREIIQKVSPGPYLELFGREKHVGWTVFGNQISDQEKFAFNGATA